MSGNEARYENAGRTTKARGFEAGGRVLPAVTVLIGTLLGVLLTSMLAPAAEPATASATRPFGIDALPPFTTSRVIGSPEAPPPYRVARVFTNLKVSFPVFIVREPDSDRLICITHDKSSGPTSIIRFRGEHGTSQFETLFNSNRMSYDLTFHPDFARNGFVYVADSGAASDQTAKTVRVVRYTMARQAPWNIDRESETTIIEWPSDGHNGAALVFGNDGMLYVTSGDGTSDSDTPVVGQDLSKLLAKVLRIDVDHPDTGRQYSIPADNPFVGTPGARGETWAYGLRNPWRISVDRPTGHIWVGNNGQDLWEQIYLVRRGDNYGWSVYEGGQPFYLDRKLGPTPHVKPTVEHHHSVARSLTGGVVYYGQKLPELRGAYIYGDYSTGKIWGVRHDGQHIVWHKELADTALQIVGFGADLDGELLVLDYRGEGQGGCYTLEPAPADNTASSFPRRLSQTGLFKSLSPLVPQAGLVPYSVNAPLWSDGASKERYFAIPASDDAEKNREAVSKGEAATKIEFTEAHGWNFPDLTVLVKSFALERTAGDASSRRLIETRLLTRQQGEWVGYSYRWNEEQTEATLVDSAGADAEFVVHSAGDQPTLRPQTWHFPSRTECMVCHSRAANFVLGLSTVQMNKDHDYGGVSDNQLRTLAHLGLIKLSKKPEEYARLIDPYDAQADLDARARSYLHANCAQCHVMAGGGNAQMELEFTTKRDKMNVFDSLPLHDKFQISEARLIAPGAPERSVLLHRVERRGRGQMPPLATSLPDVRAVELLTKWIEASRP